MWPLFLSIKYFLSKRKEGMISLIGGISVLGVALGVASLIIVLSVMNGFDLEVKEKIVGTYAHLVVMNENGIRGYQEVITDLEKMPEVKNASGFITGQAILRKGDSVSGVLLKGIDTNKESEVSQVIDYLSGNIEDLKGDKIILGSELMRNEGIRAGDTVEVMIPHSALDMEKTKLEVIGSFTSGRYDYDANMVIIGLDTARELFRIEDAVTGIGIKVNDEMAVQGLRDRLQKMLGYPYIVKSWMDLDRNLVAALALEKKMMFIILTLIVMVACFNISGSLIMMVMEKTRDIGILKAIGANSRGVSLVFLFEGAIVGLLGIITGTFLGVIISRRVNDVADLIERVTGMAVFPSDVYYFTRIPVNVSASDVSMVVLVAITLALAAGIYPAWKASRMDPVEAIRYE